MKFLPVWLLDRMSEVFGYFSPRYLSELTQHSDALTPIGGRLADYEDPWKRAQRSLHRENLERFLASHPYWDSKLTKDALRPLSESERTEPTGELLPEFSTCSLIQVNDSEAQFE